jgi:hypothetical protein
MASRTGKPVPKFDHQRTRFALRNAHAARTVQCKDCHADPRSYRDAAGLPELPQARTTSTRPARQRCESCHDDTRWKNVRFDHAKARFALLGRHLPLECKACHKSLRYRDARATATAATARTTSTR